MDCMASSLLENICSRYLLQVVGHRRFCLRSPLGYFLIKFWLGLVVFYVVDLSTFSHLVRCSVSVRRRRRASCVSSRVRCLQSWHGSDLSPKATLLVTYCVEGLVFISEGKVFQFELVELLGALLQLLGMFVEFFFQALDF